MYIYVIISLLASITIGVVICLFDEYVHNQRIIKLNRERLADDWKEGRI